LSEKEHTQLRIEEHEYDTEEEEAEETTSYSDDDSSFLSLSEKPDRNMVMLDDDEMEEIHSASVANHRSGLSFSLLGFVCFLTLVILGTKFVFLVFSPVV
jgi:hypothetical protein